MLSIDTDLIFVRRPKSIHIMHLQYDYAIYV